uniref:LAM_G_DOMAIN domain-containing protein n=1 Tax=Syphacia muris TaxID=451379 RepID=A0A0N5A7W3_9BILA
MVISGWHNAKTQKTCLQYAEVEVNLLVILGKYLRYNDENVRSVEGIGSFPAIGIERANYFLDSYGAHFPNDFFENFSIAATVKPADRDGGYLFGIVNPLDITVVLGVSLQPAGKRPTYSYAFENNSSSGGNQTYIHLHYTDPESETTTKTLASFLVPDFTHKWTTIGLEVRADSIILYFKCTQFGTKRVVNRNPRQLHLDEAYKVYIGSGGPVVGKPFAVSL